MHSFLILSYVTDDSGNLQINKVISGWYLFVIANNGGKRHNVCAFTQTASRLHSAFPPSLSSYSSKHAGNLLDFGNFLDKIF